jgi:hypothetical protein
MPHVRSCCCTAPPSAACLPRCALCCFLPFTVSPARAACAHAFLLPTPAHRLFLPAFTHARTPGRGTVPPRCRRQPAWFCLSLCARHWIRGRVLRRSRLLYSVRGHGV